MVKHLSSSSWILYAYQFEIPPVSLMHRRYIWNHPWLCLYVEQNLTIRCQNGQRSFLTKPSLLYQLVNIAPNLWKAKHPFLSVFILLDTHKYDRHYSRDLEQKIIRYFRKSRWKSRIFKMVAFVGWWPDYFCCCCCGGWTQGSEISFISGKHLERPPHYRPVDTGGGAGGQCPNNLPNLFLEML